MRVACFAATCILVAARPALWRSSIDPLPESVERLVVQSRVWLLFGLPLFLLVIKADVWTSSQRHKWRVAALTAAVLTGALALSMMPFVLTVANHPDRWQWQLAFFMRGLVFGTLMATILYFARRERESSRALHDVQMARMDAERRTAESRLQLLHAQIEPHFLFNSLASVKRLYEHEPGNGRALLRSLVTYVKIATARAGESECRLGEEITLAKAFLDIFQVRMGSRLRVRIDVPEQLENALVPSLAIGTLVENAIKHGIGPRASGGVVEICVRLEDCVLVVEVRDDGVGFRARSGHGIGLANIRARLEALFSGSAALELAANSGGGVIASLSLPYRLA